MEFLTKKRLSRRTVLKGMGVGVALPVLDAMTPAGLFSASASAAARPKVRLVAMEMVHGCAGSTKIGTEKNLWAPAKTGRDFDLSQTSLAPLEDRKSTRLNSSHRCISYAVFCLKKKKENNKATASRQADSPRHQSSRRTAA